MHVQALVTVLAIAVLVVELAFAHLPQVVLVEIVARLSLLAKALEPVFTHIVVVGPAVVMLRWLSRRWVPFRAAPAAWAMACCHIIGADRDGRSESGQPISTKERCKTEGVAGLLGRVDCFGYDAISGSDRSVFSGSERHDDRCDMGWQQDKISFVVVVVLMLLLVGPQDLPDLLVSRGIKLCRLHDSLLKKGQQQPVG